VQEEREATQRERAELEASRDELGARGSRLEGELDTLRRQLEVVPPSVPFRVAYGKRREGNEGLGSAGGEADRTTQQRWNLECVS
jgi:hypothetical protein